MHWIRHHKYLEEKKQEKTQEEQEVQKSLTKDAESVPVLVAAEEHRNTLTPTSPEEPPRGPQTVCRAFIGDVEVEPNSFRFAPDEPVAADGSGAHSRWPVLAHASWAAVQLVGGT